MPGWLFVRSSKPRYAVLALALFVTEYLIATRWKHLPFVRGELGDYLVVILLFAMVRAVWSVASRSLAVAIFVFSCLVECAQGLALADRLGFARGSWPSIIIGTTFQWSDIAMYAAGCVTVWLAAPWLDQRSTDPF